MLKGNLHLMVANKLQFLYGYFWMPPQKGRENWRPRLGTKAGTFGGDYSTEHGAQRLSATSSIRRSRRVQMIELWVGSISGIEVYERNRRICNFLQVKFERGA